jgi:hypothetical protein
VHVSDQGVGLKELIAMKMRNSLEILEYINDGVVSRLPIFENIQARDCA